jgi:hypothetical protein
MRHRAPHLLRVAAAPPAFASLIETAGAAGMRVGWLDLAIAEQALPEDLEAAAAAGVLRAVGVHTGRSVAIKPLRGAPVLRDLLREHFTGCALVLVRGAIEAPLLAPEGEGWRIAAADGGACTTAELVAILGKPKPF